MKIIIAKYFILLTSGIVRALDNRTFEFYIDCGNPPSENFTKHYQAGCLSFELISNKKKLVCNSGYCRYLSPKLSKIGRSTAAHSTHYLNDTSSCLFQKNNSTVKELMKSENFENITYEGTPQIDPKWYCECLCEIFWCL